MLVGENTALPPFEVTALSVRRRLYRSTAKASMEPAACFAAAAVAGERATSDVATVSPVIGESATAIHGVPSWSAEATHPRCTPPLRSNPTGSTSYQV